MEYKIHRPKKSKKFTLLLGWGPGQDSSRYLETIFKDINTIVIQYRDLIDFRLNITNNLLKDIIRIIREEDITIKNIVWFSFWSFLSNYLIKELKPERIINIWFLYKFQQLEDVYLNSEMRRPYKKLLNKNLNLKTQYKYIEQNLSLMGYNLIKDKITISRNDFKDLKLQLHYEKNRYFEKIIEERFRFTKRDLESVKEYYIFSWRADRCTPKSNTEEFIKEFNLKEIKQKEKEVKHSLSKWEKEILKIIK